MEIEDFVLHLDLVSVQDLLEPTPANSGGSLASPKVAKEIKGKRLILKGWLKAHPRAPVELLDLVRQGFLEPHEVVFPKKGDAA